MDRFNQQFEGEYTTNYRQMPSDTGQYFNQLQTEFQAGESNIDLIGGRDLAGTARRARLYVVKGFTPPEEAAKTLKEQLTQIIEQGS